MALLASAVGNVTVKLFAAVLSEPKFSTATAAPVVLLYIKAPLVVKLAGLHVTSLNETYAVEPLYAGGITTNVLPPAVYPLPTTSLFVEYAIVVSSNVAFAVYNAILYTYELDNVKFSSALNRFFLKTVHCV
jgi:hypothetical protein